MARSQAPRLTSHFSGHELGDDFSRSNPGLPRPISLGNFFMSHLDGEIRDGRHHMQVRVYYEDTDFSGIVYHANYLRFMERGRTNHLRLMGADQHALFAEAQAETPGFAFVVRSMQLGFLRAARRRGAGHRAGARRPHLRGAGEADSEIAAAIDEGRFDIKRFRAKWVPVRVKKTRLNMGADRLQLSGDRQTAIDKAVSGDRLAASIYIRG